MIGIDIPSVSRHETQKGKSAEAGPRDDCFPCSPVPDYTSCPPCLPQIVYQRTRRTHRGPQQELQPIFEMARTARASMDDFTRADLLVLKRVSSTGDRLCDSVVLEVSVARHRGVHKEQGEQC
jgi:hypothetical protein